jgi:RNA polymerase sigma-70 factor (ECF subfamily)
MVQDELSFAAWYEATYPSLLRTVAALTRDRNLAADLTSEAFLRALQRWHSVKKKDNPDAWVYRVAMNLVKNEWHQRRRRRLLGPALPGKPAADPFQADPQLWAAVDRLPRRQREVVILRYVADMKEDQIATTLGVSLGTVSSSLTVARKTLSTYEGLRS